MVQLVLHSEFWASQSYVARPSRHQNKWSNQPRSSLLVVKKHAACVYAAIVSWGDEAYLNGPVGDGSAGDF